MLVLMLPLKLRVEWSLTRRCRSTASSSDMRFVLAVSLRSPDHGQSRPRRKQHPSANFTSPAVSVTEFGANPTGMQTHNSEAEWRVETNGVTVVQIIEKSARGLVFYSGELFVAAPVVWYGLSWLCGCGQARAGARTGQ